MISKLFIALFSFVLVYFSYFSITTTPAQLREIDSLTYHIPLAESFARGNITDLLHIPQGLGYYPGVGEMVLSILVKLRIPLGFYNLSSIVLLFLGLRKLGQVFKLGKEYSTIFAASVCLLPSVLRLVPTQKIDIWLATLFVYLIILFKKSQKSLSYFVVLGIVTGMLIGVKYSGILVALALCLVFFKAVKTKISLKGLFGLTLPVLVIGGYWYARNYVLFGNPFFPLGLFTFPSHPDFSNIVWKSMVESIVAKGGLALIIQAYFSEFLLWTISPLIVMYYFVSTKKKNTPSDLICLKLLALILLFCLLPQPVGPYYQSAVSFMRFLFPLMITLMLLVFMIAKKTKTLNKISFVAFLSSVAVLPQFDYYPKLIIIWLIVVGIIFIKPTIKKI